MTSIAILMPILSNGTGYVKPDAHRRRRRDSTVKLSELSRRRCVLGIRHCTWHRPKAKVLGLILGLDIRGLELKAMTCGFLQLPVIKKRVLTKIKSGDKHTRTRGRLKCGSGKNGSGNIGTKERENADDENAGVEKTARFCSGGKCGS